LSAYTILMALSRQPGLVSCPVDFQSSVVLMFRPKLFVPTCRFELYPTHLH